MKKKGAKQWDSCKSAWEGIWRWDVNKNVWQGRRSERRTDGWQREWEVGKEDGKLGSPDHLETISGTLAWIFASNCHRVQRRVEREMASSFFSTTDSTADSSTGVLHVLGFHLPAFMCILEHHIGREGWWKWHVLRPKNAKKNVLHPLEVFFYSWEKELLRKLGDGGSFCWRRPCIIFPIISPESIEYGQC